MARRARAATTTLIATRISEDLQVVLELGFSNLPWKLMHHACGAVGGPYQQVVPWTT